MSSLPLSYLPCLVLVGSLYCEIIFVVIKCTGPPTNDAIGPSPAQRRAATSKNPTTCTLPSDVISHNLIHHRRKCLNVCRIDFGRRRTRWWGVIVVRRSATGRRCRTRRRPCSSCCATARSARSPSRTRRSATRGSATPPSRPASRSSRTCAASTTTTRSGRSRCASARRGSSTPPGTCCRPRTSAGGG